ncbi:MAG: hypothetical protein HC781_14940 [Leptolyngbyaceae cyanobacterium CSU_1_4]|nr:hypothetical protein [Leptolyngbyaceae cyanobacterium CSU_1_4]
MAEDLLSNSPLPNSPLPQSNPGSEDLEITSVPGSTAVYRHALLSGAIDRLATQHFLDDSQRYQLAANLPIAELNAPIETIVLDCQPLSPPFLDEFYHPPIGSPSVAAPKPELAIPATAQPYLKLRKQYPFLSLPKIHDAWEQEGLSVVLLEERSHFPSLLAVWGGQALLIEL